VAGNAFYEGGLVIDLSAMKGIHVSPAARDDRRSGRTRVRSTLGRGLWVSEWLNCLRCVLGFG